MPFYIRVVPRLTRKPINPLPRALVLRRRKMVCKFWLRTFIAALLLVNLSSWSFAETKITIGYAAVSPRTLPLIIAQEQGLFAKNGIEARLVLVKGAPILVASLVSGDIE